jgi:hypothetical protein
MRSNNHIRTAFSCFRKFLFSLSLIVSICSNSHAEEKYPAFWRKTMTNDPATNIYLAKFTRSLGNPAAEALRNVMLSLVIGHLCEGSSVNKQVANAYLRQTGYFALKGKAWDDASFLAQSEFSYFDVRALAHLCAGADYLFGKYGKLATNLLTSGSGEPKFPYDPANPYIQVPPLPKPKS